MSVETATYINDFNAGGPPGSDPRSEGDNHIRLIKTVLQNQFPGASRAMQIPGNVAFSTTGSILKTHEGSTILVTTTSAAVTLTLPSLVAGDAGWQVKIMKITSDVNPVFIKAVAGNVTSGIFSVAQARRCIPGVVVSTVWTGTAWFVSRALGLPIGSVLDLYSTTLPPGFEWPNGQTLASSGTNYPEYVAAGFSAALPNFAGRGTLALDNLGGAAPGRLTGGFIAGTTLGATGGVDGAAITTGQIPTINVSASGSISGSVTGLNTSTDFNGLTPGTGVGFWGFVSSRSPTSLSVSGSASVTGSSTNTGGVSPSARSNLLPSIMCAKILVVE
jgi:hypothetical protein